MFIIYKHKKKIYMFKYISDHSFAYEWKFSNFNNMYASNRIEPLKYNIRAEVINKILLNVNLQISFPLFFIPINRLPLVFYSWSLDIRQTTKRPEVFYGSKLYSSLTTLSTQPKKKKYFGQPIRLAKSSRCKLYILECEILVFLCERSACIHVDLEWLFRQNCSWYTHLFSCFSSHFVAMEKRNETGTTTTWVYIYDGDVLLAANSTRSKLNYRNDNDNVLGCIVCVCVWVLGMWWFYLNMYVSWQANVVRCPGNMLHQTNSLYSLLFIASGNRKMYCYFIVLVKWLFYYTFSGSKTINNWCSFEKEGKS